MQKPQGKISLPECTGQGVTGVLLNEDGSIWCFKISVAILLHGRISLADADVRGEVACHGRYRDHGRLHSTLGGHGALDGSNGRLSGRLGVGRWRWSLLLFFHGARNHEAAGEGAVAGQAVDVRQRHQLGHGGETRALRGHLLGRSLADAASRASLRGEVDADVDKHHDAARDVERAQCRVEHVADVLA